MFLHDDTGAIQIGVRFAERGDDPFAAPFRRPQIHEQHLVFAMIDNPAQRFATAHQIGCCELAFKNGKLQVVSEAAHQLEHLPQPLLVRDVITN